MRRYHVHPQWNAGVYRVYVSTNNSERRKLKRDGWEVVRAERIGPLLREHAPISHGEIVLMNPGTWYLLPIGVEVADNRDIRRGPRWVWEGLRYEHLRRGDRVV